MPKTAFSLSAKTTGSLVVLEDKDAVDRLIGGTDLVHRVFGDIKPAGGVGGDLTRKLHGRHGGDEPDLEAVWHFGQRGESD